MFLCLYIFLDPLLGPAELGYHAKEMGVHQGGVKLLIASGIVLSQDTIIKVYQRLIDAPLCFPCFRCLYLAYAEALVHSLMVLSLLLASAWLVEGRRDSTHPVPKHRHLATSSPDHVHATRWRCDSLHPNLSARKGYMQSSVWTSCSQRSAASVLSLSDIF